MNEPFNLDENIFVIKKWQESNPNLRVGFTTRRGGVSEEPYNHFNFGLHVDDLHENVIENRNLLAQKLHFAVENWVCAEQVHGVEIKIVDDEDKGKGASSMSTSIKGTDGIITNKPGILCTAFFADCVPLFFYDPETGYVGIAHAGWKGTVKGIAAEMVHALIALGVSVNQLQVAIGPSISQQFYEVDDYVMKQIPKQHVDKTVTYLENGRYMIDLKQLNVEILLQNGILRHNIERTNLCTFRDEELFFSHRRDNGKTGRMLGYIGFDECL
ncbi:MULTISPECIES: peptidoglycan editing factor PgeF [unclassified Virgibacillus]|uniref:peptidoglycan editing factor PgeF n=1 Tax=unclassified Virgibacillus TaxID=2620237 RepID=UPI0024DE9E2F|nr:peptidoglycan editing factor PgeF [Virgibacillus sp. LDC-1]